MTCRLLVADGHWLIRCGLRSVLHGVGGNEVIGEAADTRAVLAHTLALAPDIALIDLRLPDDGGLSALRLIKQQRHTQKVILLCDGTGEHTVREALRAGCDGYVRKDASSNELLAAIRGVQGGQVYLDAEISRRMVLADHRRETQGHSGPLHALSARELAVFNLVGAGCTNRVAAERLQLSPKTVEKYRAAVMQKLRLRTAVDLRLLALQLGEGQASAAGAAAGAAAVAGDSEANRGTRFASS